MNKYRAWDKEKKEMYGVYGWNEIDKKVYMCSVPESKFRDGSMHTWHQVTKKMEDVILMQSTGLKGYMDDSFNDWLEKEVYQGDVIDIFWEEWPAGYYQENHMIGVVDLDETGTAWIIKNAKYDFDNPEPIPNKIGDMEISRSLPDDEDLEEVFLHNFNLTSDDITILGNIHANPELLKEVE